MGAALAPLIFPPYLGRVSLRARQTLRPLWPVSLCILR
jgi:hypothetical protein